MVLHEVPNLFFCFHSSLSSIFQPIFFDIHLGKSSQSESLTQSEFFAQSSYKHSQVAFNELTIEKEIGEGSYGKVCLGKWNKALVALKFCKKKGKMEEFMAEVKLMMYVLIVQ
jgi:hypothetical protein